MKDTLPPVTPSAFEALLADTSVIEADSFGPKVVLRQDGTYLKIFRRKRLLSSAAWYPYAQRFADNAARLASLGIPCPQVLSLQRFTAAARDVVHYRALPGETLRQHARTLACSDEADTLRHQLGRLLAELHRHGILFRSIHLGNVIRDPDGRLGLIDFADLKFHRRSLSLNARRRNFAHLLRYAEDQHWLRADGGAAFISGYLAASDKTLSHAQLTDWLQQQGEGR